MNSISISGFGFGFCFGSGSDFSSKTGIIGRSGFVSAREEGRGSFNGLVGEYVGGGGGGTVTAGGAVIGLVCSGVRAALRSASFASSTLGCGLVSTFHLDGSFPVSSGFVSGLVSGMVPSGVLTMGV